jgi:NAD-dependent dihydropyrimidine dehydrogenase PreA subunit
MDPFDQTSYRQIRVGHVMVGMNGLEEIFSALYAEGFEPNAGAIPELLERARQHNYIPSFSEEEYTRALLSEFREFCRQQDLGDTRISDYGTWRGHPREAIPWYPTLNAGRCDGCGACVRFCPQGVFACEVEDKVEVVKPYRCQVGCSTCAQVCELDAIIFPPPQILEAFRPR